MRYLNYSNINVRVQGVKKTVFSSQKKIFKKLQIFRIRNPFTARQVIYFNKSVHAADPDREELSSVRTTRSSECINCPLHVSPNPTPS